MGATEIYVEQAGSSMREALSTAQDQARSMYGDDYYNGRINNCSLVRDVTDKYNAMSKKQKSNYVDQIMCDADKGEVYGVCLTRPKESTRKQKTKVERFPQKGARKWVTKYVVEDYRSDKKVGEWEDQGTAIKEARAYTERTGKRTAIEITKVLLGGKTLVANVTPIQGNGKQGLYMFFGSAPN